LLFGVGLALIHDVAGQFDGVLGAENAFLGKLLHCRGGKCFELRQQRKVLRDDFLLLLNLLVLVVELIDLVLLGAYFGTGVVHHGTGTQPGG